MAWIGTEEYNSNFCRDRLELQEGESPALLRDFKNAYTTTVDKEGGQDESTYGCCRIPKGVTRISRRKYCIYTPDYKNPSLQEKLSYFLKRFK